MNVTIDLKELNTIISALYCLEDSSTVPERISINALIAKLNGKYNE